MRNYSWILILLLAMSSMACGGVEEQQEEASNATNNANQDDQNLTDAEYVEQATFTDFDGNKVSISDFEGKVVLIDFWETWCKPCLASFPTMQKVQEEYSDSFVVLAVTPGFSDTQKDAQEFAEEHDYTFKYLMDSNNLHQKLGVQGIPFKVYVDAEGNFIEKSMGTSGPQGDYKKLKKIIEQYK
ncbi:TlpA disulfide reductase family protein [Fodinibius sp.]|uniref:TlpA family protein disulfide reductase n=1 Tax=Fodinibius sp. TaxID=1872440 RepID=UPI002ACEFD8C|nr:TlpA disulfide reductase family protein [Fodinibius sp.]MDZ7659525.1 TlpA disulfide reductase family protein [Fodinibius sp.]